jgi:hypothetical protein
MSDLLYRNSYTWRTVVAATKASPLFFMGFSALTLGACYIAAQGVMNSTNPNFKEEGYKRQEDELKKQPLDIQARATDCLLQLSTVSCCYELLLHATCNCGQMG